MLSFFSGSNEEKNTTQMYSDLKKIYVSEVFNRL